jgi:hypothetical protein
MVPQARRAGEREHPALGVHRPTGTGAKTDPRPRGPTAGGARRAGADPNPLHRGATPEKATARDVQGGCAACGESGYARAPALAGVARAMKKGQGRGFDPPAKGASTAATTAGGTPLRATTTRDRTFVVAWRDDPRDTAAIVGPHASHPAAVHRLPARCSACAPSGAVSLPRRDGGCSDRATTASSPGPTQPPVRARTPANRRTRRDLCPARPGRVAGDDRPPRGRCVPEACMASAVPCAAVTRAPGVATT